MTDDENEELLQIHDQLSTFFRKRQFDDACRFASESRQRALDAGKIEQASELSGILATCLSLAKKDDEALVVAREAEQIDPTRPDAKLGTAYLLLHYADEPHEALGKVESALTEIGPEHPSWYRALALLGTARARAGNLDAALATFREMTAPDVLQNLAAANYAGVYDLSVVEELVKAGRANDETRRYLEIVRAAPQPSGSVGKKISELLAALERVPPN
jgi:tetratricopeptide (TPR) repeat protein